MGLVSAVGHTQSTELTVSYVDCTISKVDVTEYK